MDPKLSNALRMLIMFLKMTPLNDFAAKLEQDLVDGSISVADGVGLAEIAATEAQSFLPGQKNQLELVKDVAHAVAKYIDATGAVDPPAPA